MLFWSFIYIFFFPSSSAECTNTHHIPKYSFRILFYIILKEKKTDIHTLLYISSKEKNFIIKKKTLRNQQDKKEYIRISIWKRWKKWIKDDKGI